MPKPKIKPGETAGGIPNAVREGAKAADGDVVELGESLGGQRLGDTTNLAETAAKTVMVRAVESKGGGVDGLALIQQTAADLVRGAGDVDANILGTVMGAVIGAMEAGRDTGIDKQDAATAAAIGAIEGAGEIGDGAVEDVKRLVTGPIGTITPIVDSTFAKGRRTP